MWHTPIRKEKLRSTSGVLINDDCRCPIEIIKKRHNLSFFRSGSRAFPFLIEMAEQEGEPLPFIWFLCGYTFFRNIFGVVDDDCVRPGFVFFFVFARLYLIAPKKAQQKKNCVKIY